MLMFEAPFGSSAFGESPNAARILRQAAPTTSITLSSLITLERGLLVPERKVAEGKLIASTTTVWTEIVRHLGNNWALAMQLSPRQWEEIIAGAFKKAGYDEVILTPASADKGRDVIAIKKGVGSIKIIGSVKAYKPDHLVTHDDVRALLGVLAAEPDASKGIVTTTSGFAPQIMSSPQISRFLPTRLELVDGEGLQKWLTSLSDAKV
jgi:restriction system protein